MEAADSLQGLYRQKTTLRTIRLPSAVADTLEAIAAEQGITFNALANRVMKRFAEFDCYAAKLEFVTMPRATLRSILESADSKSLERAGAETGRHVPSEISFFFYKEIGLPVFLKHLENMSRYYRMGAVAVAKGEEKTVVAINHDLGANWSAFLSQYLTHAAKGITGLAPASESSEGQVSLHFKTSGLGLHEYAVKGRP